MTTAAMPLGPVYPVPEPSGRYDGPSCQVFGHTAEFAGFDRPHRRCASGSKAWHGPPLELASVGSKLDTMTRLRGTVHGLRVPVDILVTKPDDFAWRKEIVG